MIMVTTELELKTALMAISLYFHYLEVNNLPLTVRQEQLWKLITLYLEQTK
jgi:hypothetical protein